jgi:D-glycero-D-manno-heptose 1,7-bisphosphate phosphatase
VHPMSDELCTSKVVEHTTECALLRQELSLAPGMQSGWLAPPVVLSRADSAVQRIDRWSPQPRAVFIDRDGVINENRPDHVKNWTEFRFIAGAREALARLSEAGVRVFVVSNQAIVNRGLVSSAEVDAINQGMVTEVDRSGGRIEAIAYCPHRAEEHCSCRKPEPGLLQVLASQFDLDLAATVLIGDALSDIQAGSAAGCPTVLVLTGRGREQLALARSAGNDAFRVADDLNAAIDLLLEERLPESAGALNQITTQTQSLIN